MSEAIIATVTGLFVGFLFSALKLPIPAPPYLSGVMGIVVIYLRMHTFQQVIRLFFS